MFIEQSCKYGRTRKGRITSNYSFLFGILLVCTAHNGRWKVNLPHTHTLTVLYHILHSSRDFQYDLYIVLFECLLGSFANSHKLSLSVSFYVSVTRSPQIFIQILYYSLSTPFVVDSVYDILRIGWKIN